jgi:phosphoadenosine phosphosulfate reductase
MADNNISQLLGKTKGLEPVEILKTVAGYFGGETIFTTSFGYEDQVIADMIFTNDLPIRVVTLDTGRLFEETYKVFARTKEKYGKEIAVFFPGSADVEKLLNEKGPISFYESVENRKECCHIRKVIPLERALKGYKCWITGIRADQSPGRKEMGIVEWDEAHGLTKVNPLLEWDIQKVKEYARMNNVPYNALHDRGFVSIGCEPCTRAVKPGEDFRAGRWWWEQNSGKECGLHEK